MKIALCGIMGALIITILFLGFLFPFATYACPAIAACCLLPIVHEYGQKTAFTLYLAVSFLAVMLVPEQEMVFMFIFVFGFYTVIKFTVDKIKSKTLRIILKLIYVNTGIIISYGILLFVFPVAMLVEEFSVYGIGFIVILMVMFNALFILYDKAAATMLIVYIYRLRPKIFGK